MKYTRIEEDTRTLGSSPRNKPDKTLGNSPGLKHQKLYLKIRRNIINEPEEKHKKKR